MDLMNYETNIETVLSRAKVQRPQNSPITNTLADIQKELRHRRKRFLTSYISLKNLVAIDSKVDDDLIEALAQYLARRTIAFWKTAPESAEAFCFDFFKLAICAITLKHVRSECVDDILQIVDCLINSKHIFTIALKDLLPTDRYGELFDFIDTYDDSYRISNFGNAALGAIAVLTGALQDPLEEDTSNG